MKFKLWNSSNIDIRPGGQFAKLGNIGLPDIVSAGVRLILVIAALISFVTLVIGGVKWILSGGDKAATESARNTITAALVGLLIVFGSWAVIRLIEVFFGISILTLTIPTVGGF